jgi:hypothetical protein
MQKIDYTKREWLSIKKDSKSESRIQRKLNPVAQNNGMF